MTSRGKWCVLLAVLMVMAASASIAGQPVTLRVMTWHTVEEMAELHAEFMKAHPDIRVEHVWNQPGASFQERLQVLTLAGELPDVFAIPGGIAGALRELIEIGALKDIADRVAADINVGDLMPLSLIPDYNLVDGRTYALPLWGTVAAVSIVLNRDMFSEVGLALPDLNWTWDDFLEKARRLTRDKSGDGRRDAYGLILPLMNRYHVWLWSGGGRIVNDDATRTLIDHPDSVAAIQWLADLNLVHDVAAGMPGDGKLPVQGNPAFFQGHGGMSLQSSSAFAASSQQGQVQFDWSLAKIPGGKGGSQSVVFSTLWGVAANTLQADAAWTYMQWRMGLDGQLALARITEGRWPPLTRSALLETNWTHVVGPPYDWTPVLDQDGRLLPQAPGMLEIGNMIQRGIEGVWRGERPALQMVQELAPALNARLEEIRKGQ